MNRLRTAVQGSYQPPERSSHPRLQLTSEQSPLPQPTFQQVAGSLISETIRTQKVRRRARAQIAYTQRNDPDRSSTSSDGGSAAPAQDAEQAASTGGWFGDDPFQLPDVEPHDASDLDVDSASEAEAAWEARDDARALVSGEPTSTSNRGGGVDPRKPLRDIILVGSALIWDREAKHVLMQQRLRGKKYAGALRLMTFGTQAQLSLLRALVLPPSACRVALMPWPYR
jgi:hypothetical protein